MNTFLSKMNINKKFQILVYIYVLDVLFSAIPLSLQSDEGPADAEKHDEGAGDEEEDPANEILILEKGDPYTFLLTNEHTGCMFATEDDIPDDQKGNQSYKEHCSSEKKCKLYTKPMNDSNCLRPTHFLCDPTTNTCVCGNENVIISAIRFQVGTESGKDYKNGACLIRPTFDYIPGFECAPGSFENPVTAGENAEPVPICKCEWENEYDFDKFNTTDPEWWKCGRASVLFHSNWYFVLSIGISLSTIIK